MENLSATTCCSCGVVFGMTPALEAIRRKDGAIFHCPNGHGQKYAKPETDEKEAELKKLRADFAAVSTRATKLQQDVDALKAELEVWRPASAVANGAGMPDEEKPAV
jgi:hypothetical protein